MSRVGTTSTPTTGQTSKTTQTVQPTPMARPVSSTVRPPLDRVAKLAYEKWVKRGCVHGFDVQDWVEAEKELMAEHSRPTTASATIGAHR